MCGIHSRSTLTLSTSTSPKPLILPLLQSQEIHDRITSFNYQDAKVWVSTIDSQASANGGIVIQVIGELSNNNGPWRRFAQTFFLAEQPKGYFVLNDIFRFLKDESEVEGVAEALDEDAQGEAEAAEAKAVAEQQDALTAPEIQVVSSSAPVEEKPSEVVLENVNQPGATPHVEPSTEPKETLQSIADSVTDNSVAPVQEKSAAPVEEPTKEVESVSTPAAAQTPSAAPAVVESSTSAPAAPTPAVPAAPKTWANLAASGASKWGSNVSAEARATSARPAPISASPASRPAVSTGPKPAGNGPSSSSTSNPSVFIKSVNLDIISQEELRSGLESQYGKLRECSVIPLKGCAFAEFVNQDHARKAIKDSLPVNQGGQGGIVVGKRNWVITIEEKRGAGGKPGNNPGGARGGRGGGNQGARNGAGGAARNNAPRGRTQA